MNNCNWIYQVPKSDYFKEIPINEKIKNFLEIKGFSSLEESKKFLHPTLDNLGNSEDLSDVKKATKRILESIKKNETIWIYGDYDVDGITSTSLCYHALTKIGAHVRYYIPLRDEGYGLNSEALSYIKSEGGTLVITVDCGITSHGDIAHSNEIGLEVIITDHHDIIGGKIPDAYAVINPKREDNIYPFKYLAGVGTVFMLLRSVYKNLGIEELIYDYLDLVAIGTVADIVPLQDDNRIIVKHGLEKLGSSKSSGLLSLLSTLFPEDYSSRKYSPVDIGFGIAPIFNAAGRLEDAKSSVELLINSDKDFQDKTVPKLISNNNERKLVQENILKLCNEEIESKKLYEKNIILVASKDFHHGVIGIVASKILDRYYKPTIVMEINEESGIAKGSCRSTEAFNMIEALTNFSDLLVKFGGHHGAAGFSIKIEDLENFYEKLEEYSEGILHEKDKIKPIRIQEDISLCEVNYDLVNNLKTLEPFGFGNGMPLFSISNVSFKDVKIIGKDKSHLSMTLVDNRVELRNCMWFSGAHNIEDLLSSISIDVVFRSVVEKYLGKYYTKIQIVDVRSSLKEKNDTPKVDFPITTVINCKKDTNSNYLSIRRNRDFSSITENKELIGYLDSQSHFLLENSSFEEEISVKVLKKEVDSGNISLFIQLFNLTPFTTKEIKDGGIFREIKEHFYKYRDYTENEKLLLRKVILEKEEINYKDLSTSERDLLLTNIALYNYVKEKKVLILTKEFLPTYLYYYCDIVEEIYFSDKYKYNVVISV